MDDLKRIAFYVVGMLCFDFSTQADLGRENEAMSSFVNGVNHIVKSPITPKSQTSSRTEKTPESTNGQNTRACAKISCSKDANYFDDEDLVRFCIFCYFYLYFICIQI